MVKFLMPLRVFHHNSEYGHDLFLFSSSFFVPEIWCSGLIFGEGLVGRARRI